MTIRFWSGWICAVALAAGLVSCSSSKKLAADMKPVSDRKAAPDFSLKDSNGATVKLSDYKGKVVLLNFWATWCGPCKVEIPWFITFEQQYKAQDFAVLGISFDDEGWTVVKPYVDQHKINYRVLLGNDDTSKLFGGVDSLPTTLVIDRDGRIASDHVGLVAKKTYEDEILSLLDTKKDGSKTSVVGPPSFWAMLWAK